MSLSHADLRAAFVEASKARGYPAVLNVRQAADLSGMSVKTIALACETNLLDHIDVNPDGGKHCYRITCGALAVFIISLSLGESGFRAPFSTKARNGHHHAKPDSDVPQLSEARAIPLRAEARA